MKITIAALSDSDTLALTAELDQADQKIAGPLAIAAMTRYNN